MTDLLTYVCNKMTLEETWTVGFQHGLNALAYYGRNNVPADCADKHSRDFRKKTQIKAFKTGFAMGLASHDGDWK